MILRVIHAALRLLDGPRLRAFESAANDPAAAQAKRLRGFLRENAGTAYGRIHQYGRIESVRDFQARVPVMDGEALAPWTARIAAGEARVLTDSRVRVLERTTGTAGDKLVPYTDRFLGELRSALVPWLADLFRAHPELRGLRQYWSLSPVARRARPTAGGVPVGFGDDTAYLSPASRAAMRQVMAVPGKLARIPDITEWRRQTISHLLAADNLGLISVWSPSFLTLLMQAAERDLPQHLATLPAHRADGIRMRLDAAGRFVASALWPRLRVISCWTDGPAASQVEEMVRYFPGIQVQGKGLLATEGVVSFPLCSDQEMGAVAAAGSHFLEFIDLDSPAARPLLLHDLREGGVYSPLLTTGGGLARYHLKDVVRCTGHAGRLPLLRFQGKLDRVSDQVGEKLVAARVEAVILRLAGEMGVPLAFALLAPVEEVVPRYVLFAESRADDAALQRLAHGVDAALREDHHYGYCRDLGQLGPISFRRVLDGWESYQRVMADSGTRLGDIKPTCLDVRTNWPDTFITPGDEQVRGPTRSPAPAPLPRHWDDGPIL